VPDARERRIAENEVRFRAINERLEADLRRLPLGGERLDFICECGHGDCTATVSLTIEEYERVRTEPTLFAMLPGHDIPDVEDVLTVTERYTIARKKPPSHPIVEATDPRAG
jgi:hypothetical protein